MTAIEVACKNLGSQRALAVMLGVTPATVNQWISGIRPIPAERCPAIERATAGAVTCEDLRPDVDWAYLRGTAKGKVPGSHECSTPCAAGTAEPKLCVNCGLRVVVVDGDEECAA